MQYTQPEAKCRHFNGVMNKQCCAGVAYADVRSPGVPGRGFSLACFSENDLCDKRSCYSAEELAAQDAEMVLLVERVNKARRAIIDKTKGVRGAAGTMKCPCCEAGELQYLVARSNGHIHAKCSTDKCVSWME